MSTRLSLLATLLLLAATACGDSSRPGPDPQPPGTLVRSDVQRDLSPEVSDGDLGELVAGNSAFAFDLYRAVRDRGGNLFYSPHSISAALAMTYAGARTQTEDEMAATLHFTLGQDTLHPAFNALALELARRGQDAQGVDGHSFRLHIVNALWGQDGHGFLDDYLDLLAANYGAGLRLMPFATDPDGSRQAINTWVAEVTEARIRDLLPPGSVSTLTRLVLTNAIYFNAAWASQFDAANTRDGTFRLRDGDGITVPMMHQEEKFGYATGDGYEAIELRYDGDELSMVVLLPEAGGFDAFESTLEYERIVGIIGELELTQLELAMPKFEYTTPLGLKELLAALGMPSAFAPAVADFSGIDGSRDLFVSDVLHKAFVAVNEAGTEAAAATAVIVGTTSMPPPPIPVHIDRPFVFLIRDIETEAILFVGRVLDPRG